MMAISGTAGGPPLIVALRLGLDRLRFDLGRPGEVSVKSCNNAASCSASSSKAGVSPAEAHHMNEEYARADQLRGSINCSSMVEEASSNVSCVFLTGKSMGSLSSCP